MKRQYSYRIYPTRKQETIMQQTLEECCWLYNYLLEQRINHYRDNREDLSVYDCQKLIPNLKRERLSLNIVYSQTLQDVAKRIELAFQGFYRRLKSGQKPGFPRFKGKGWYDSFTYTQSGFKILENSKLKLTKIGEIKISLHRPINGQVKRLTIKRTPTGKWFAFFVVEAEYEQLQPSSKVVGIDLGLKNFITQSDGTVVNNPRFFKQEEKNIIKANRNHSKKKTSKSKKRLARVHERVTNKRLNFCNQLAHTLVSVFQIIVFEDLSVQKMQEENKFGKNFNKSIADVSWRKLISATQSAAESATRTVVLVDPRDTSKICSQCGNIVEKSLNDRTHKCICGLEIDRDLNAARNILALGLQRLAKA